MGLGEIVGDEEGGELLLADDALGGAEDHLGRFGVEGGGGLVEQEDVGGAMVLAFGEEIASGYFLHITRFRHTGEIPINM